MTKAEIYSQLELTQRDMRLVIGKRTRQLLRNKGFAELADNSADAKLFRYLVESPRNDVGDVPLPQSLYARLMDTDPSNCCIKKHLNRLRDRYGITVRDSGYDKPSATQPGRARDVVAMILPPEIADIINERHPDDLTRTGLFSQVSGRLLKPEDLRGMHTRRVAAAALVNEDAPGDLHREYLHYLNEHLSLYDFPIGKEAISEALAWIDQLDIPAPAETPTMTKSRQCAVGHAWRSLLFVSRFPQPTYSIVDKSPRFYTVGYSLATMPAALRRILLPNATDCDLTAAQAAIYSALCDIKPLQEILEGQNSLWKELIDFAGLDPWSDIAEEEAMELLPEEIADYRVSMARLKGVLKSHLAYALSFGMEEYHLLRVQRGKNGRIVDNYDDMIALVELSESPGRDIPSTVEVLMSHPAIVAWVAARDALLEKIITNSGMKDAWGRWIPLHKDGDRSFDAKSVLAFVIQSYEVGLMEPVMQAAIEEAKKARPLWKIVLHQHDGVSIAGEKSRLPYIIRRLQDAVAARAKSLIPGATIATKLEVK